MKKTILGLSVIAAILLTGCGGETKETFYDNGALKTVASYNSEKKLDGNYKYYWSDGGLKKEAVYSDGKLNGLYKEWDYNHELTESCEYKAGKKYKDCKIYRNGKLARIENYNEQEKLHGKATAYDKKGNVTEEGSFSNGKKDGVFTRHGEYKGEMILIETSAYKNGLRHGKSDYFLEDGTRVYLAEFNEGVLVEAEVLNPRNKKETSKVKSNGQFISYLLGVQILTPYEQFDGLKRK